MLTRLRKPSFLKTVVLNKPAGDRRKRRCRGANPDDPTSPCADCYSCKGPSQFSNVQAAYERNRAIAESESGDFWVQLSAEVRQSRADAVRPHSSGDIESQFELDQWTAAAAENSLKTFYLYTKSLDLDWSDFDALPNTTRIQSLGGVFDSDIDWNKPVCVVIQKSELDSFTRNGWTNCGDDDALAAFGCKRICIVQH